MLVEKYSEGEAECQNQLICRLWIRKQKEFTLDILENGGKFPAQDYC